MIDADRLLAETRQTAEYWRESRVGLLALLTGFWLDEPRFMALAQGWSWPRRHWADWAWAAAIPGTLFAALLIMVPEFIPQFLGIGR